MAGIAGLISNGSEASLTGIGTRMLAAMPSRGDSKSGSLYVGQVGAWVGWNVTQGSFSDCLPVWNDAKNICLLFIGEHFCDEQPAQSYPAANSPSSDSARWMANVYEQTSEDFFRCLNGFFSGIVIDHRYNPPKVILFNDRFGLGRIYYAETHDSFYFASEAKSILAVIPAVRQIEKQSFGELIACGCVLENRSLFCGINLLPPAAAWTWQDATKPHRRTYFDFDEWLNQPTLTPSAFYEEFKDTFTRIVPRYLSGRQQIAMSITGGVDSRMIMAALRPSADTLSCYTFGGMYRDCADVIIGRQVAKACEQQHQVLSLSHKFFADFPELARRSVHLTDGTMDVSGAASLYMNLAAREIAPIRLTGNYGGEILRGIIGLKCSTVDETVFDSTFLPYIRGVPGRLHCMRHASERCFVASKQVPWFHYAMFAAEQSQVTVRTPYLDNELVALAFRSPPEFTLNKNPAFRYIWDSEPRLATVPTDRGFVWSPNVRLEANRSRLRRLREEFLPRAEYAFDYGMPNWLAKIDRLLAPLRLERLFLGNQKFAHYRIWYRRELSGFVREMLLDPRTLTRSYLDRRSVERVVSSHLKGTVNHTRTIHKLLTCELIHRSLIEGFAP